jgi:AraC family transcriptional regulator, transcriptional activator of pobA
MDERWQSWYFSKMPRAPATDLPAGESRSTRRVGFNRTKYGRHLLIDVEWVHDIPTFILDAPHVLDFYDIIVVTRGRGACWLDGQRHTVRPGVVLFTTPGQVRQWKTTALDGVCLFFMDTFIREFLQDDSFLHRLPYFQGDPARAAMRLTPAAARRMRTRLAAMRRELADYRSDSVHLLRAHLHEALIVLAREYAAAYQVTASRPTHSVVSRYFELVERDAARRHRVAEYAAELGVSAGHLSVLCGRYAGRSAKRHLHDALVTRARRMLLYTDESAARIGSALGFDDPSYFSRFFRRETGVTPSAFRAAAALPSGARSSRAASEPTSLSRSRGSR